MQKVACRSNCRSQLNNEIFALLSTRVYCLKIDHLIERIGITLSSERLSVINLGILSSKTSATTGY
ncbi:hypothetical protein EVU92_10270 [Pseudoalteromonas sp. MEBiC 03485]|nr:hypothetical protein EVU92_10270 [Pseudoalteromonas sp. MEBiC 03485]